MFIHITSMNKYTQNSAFPNNSEIFFNSVLYPSRSLSYKGFFWLMLVLIVILTLISFFFYKLGAWPILFFTIFDVLLIWGAFKLNYKNGKTHEIIKLTYLKLEITRIYPDGKKNKFLFEPSWVQVKLENPKKHNSRISISSHGNQITVGDFLPPKERYEITESLNSALKNRVDFIQKKLPNI